MAPSMFEQVYVIRVPIGETAVTVAYCLLEKKDQATYEEMLQILLDECEQRSIFPEPEVIMADFEKAIHNAVGVLFDNQVQMKGCFFHLTQSVWRKVQQLGLAKQYREDEEFRLFVGMIFGLAFLPVAYVKEGLTYICSVAPDDALELLGYFDATYVNGGYKSVRAPNGIMRLKRINPLYSLELWNVNHATLTGSARTNNICESWNCKYFNMVGHRHPSIWRTINAFQMDNASVSALIALDNVGQCQDFDNGQKRVPQFLRGISHNMRLLC
ncbi:uncharacterized protein LOC141898982 [Tubulanus polymorphus]|uniref:uncharacterized protein LOC141898982 n=1 Tax=Tubulanus polymorphus TaxID=672921 RepID=UPI003DA5F917